MFQKEQKNSSSRPNINICNLTQWAVTETYCCLDHRIEIMMYSASHAYVGIGDALHKSIGSRNSLQKIKD